MADRALPVVICIDLEPDAREVDRANPAWHGAAEVLARVPTLRAELERAADCPVPLNWFVRADPQVAMTHGHPAWALERFGDALHAMASAGDQIGLHTHAWRWLEAERVWCQDHADDAWVEHCVACSLATYRGFFGRSAPSYRGGDRFLSNAVVRQIEAAGIQVDISIERMPVVARLLASERGTGGIPDGTMVPPSAYRPCATDFRRPDPQKRDGLVIMPLTASAGRTLWSWLIPAHKFANTVERLLAGQEPLTHLAFVVRSDLHFIAAWDTFVGNVTSLARRAARGRLKFATATAALDDVRARLG